MNNTSYHPHIAILLIILMSVLPVRLVSAMEMAVSSDTCAQHQTKAKMSQDAMQTMDCPACQSPDDHSQCTNLTCDHCASACMSGFQHMLSSTSLLNTHYSPTPWSRDFEAAAPPQRALNLLRPPIA